LSMSTYFDNFEWEEVVRIDMSCANEEIES
jgi:hypothetical protein